MKKIQKIGMTVASPILATGIIITPTANAFMMTDFAPADDATSRSIVQTGNLSCTGVLIAPQYVLTASHCVASTPYGPVDKLPNEVLIGPDVENREKVAVESAVTHPVYDIALIKLKEDAQTIPAKVYTEQQPLDLNAEISSYGWGTLAAAQSSSDLISKEDISSIQKNVAANKVRKVEGNIVNGRVDIDENGNPIKNDKGQIVISRYTSAKGFDKMKDDNAGVNIKFTDPSKSVYGDSGAPIFSENTLYGILSGGLLDIEQLNEGSTIVASPIYKILPWLEENTGIDFTNAANNEQIDSQVSSANISFRDAEVSPEDIERERELIKKYKENLEESDIYEEDTNKDVNGDVEVDTPIDQKEKSENNNSSNTDSQSTVNDTDNTDNSTNTDDPYTITDNERNIIDSGYGDLESEDTRELSNNDQLDNNESSTLNNETATPVENTNTQVNTRDNIQQGTRNVSDQVSAGQNSQIEDEYDNETVGPKVDTGGNVHTSFISRIIHLFR